MYIVHKRFTYGGTARLQMTPTLKLIHLGKQPFTPKNTSKSQENNKIIVWLPNLHVAIRTATL